MAIRSLELLIRTYPDKTGRELLEMQIKDKEKEEERIEKKMADASKWVEKVNKKGLYIKYNFGLDQSGFYKITNAAIDDFTVYIDVESIIFFTKEEFSITKRKKICQKEDRYSVRGIYPGQKIITKKEWDEVNNTFENLVKLYGNFEWQET